MIRAALLAIVLAGPAGAEGSSDAAARVVGLGGTVTEIVVALGAGDRLVGRDTTSGYPPPVLALPDVGYLRQLSAEGVLSLSPDLMIAEADAGPPEVVAQLQSTGLGYVTLPQDWSADGVAARITTVGAALGREAEAARLAHDVSARLAETEAKAQALPAPRKRVMFVLSLQGGRIMAAGQGTAADAVITMAGAENALQGFEGYKPVSDEAVQAAAPDVVLMMDRPGALDRPAAEVLALPAFAGSPAAQNGALLQMDGLRLLGFGPRLPDALADLQAALSGG